MGRRKTTKPQDRHKARVMVGIPQTLADILEREAGRQFKSLTGLVVEICREYAEQKGFLPGPTASEN